MWRGHGSEVALRLLVLFAASSILARANRVEVVVGEVGGLLESIADHEHVFVPPLPSRPEPADPPESEAVFDYDGGIPGDFNLYIFAMSWKPEWCYHSPFPGCSNPRSFWEDNLTIHGLWPDYGDGTYPTTCTSEAYDHDRVVKAIGIETLETVWPNVQVPEDAGKKYDSFWEHEWTKHGTCTGLTQEKYFLAAVKLLQQRFQTPATLSQNVGGTTTRDDLEDAYGGDGMAVLDCKGHRYLNQVMLCLEVDPETGSPGEQMACPEAVIAHDDKCGQGSIQIASF